MSPERRINRVRQNLPSEQEAAIQPPAASANVRHNSFCRRTEIHWPVYALEVPALSPSTFVSIADLRHAAKKRLPQIVFDYIDGGAEDEWTLEANCRAFREVMLRPRSAVQVSAATDLSTTILGTPLALPFLLAPIGSSRMFYPRAEVAAAHEAGKAG